ncbi:MAG TPA: hypothetical protein VFB54_05880 [Burkholderiales bacterium]|nr:hypothetical protein [Burkholderiales bacterium]
MSDTRGQMPHDAADGEHMELESQFALEPEPWLPLTRVQCLMMAIALDRDDRCLRAAPRNESESEQ